MDEKKPELTEDLEQVVGGTDTTGQAAANTENPFADLPRVDSNPYTADVTSRA